MRKIGAVISDFSFLDESLINEIRNTLGDSVTRIFMKNPEVDMREEDYPSVSIYNRGMSVAKDRTAFNRFNKEILSKADLTRTVKDPPVSYNFSYQLDFWSRLQTDMNKMLMLWNQKHNRQFNLPIIGGEKDVMYSCNCMIKGGFTRADLVVGSKRLIHNIQTLRIWVEIDSGNVYNEIVTKEVNVNTQTKN